MKVVLLKWLVDHKFKKHHITDFLGIFQPTETLWLIHHFLRNAQEPT